jgi:ketosteroid isomerase-like protein
MIRRIVVVGMLVAGLLSAQSKGGKAKFEPFDFRSLMQQIWDGWGTLSPATTAKFYSKDAQRTFFDLTPLKYTGWSEYDAGVRKAFADYSSGKFTLNSDQHVAQRPTIAWATSTGHGILNKKSGGKDEMDFRWTVIWEKIENQWLIVHEHISAPLAAPAPAKPPAAPTKK